MQEQTIIIYCICEEVIKCLRFRDDIQCKMSSAEVMTFAISAALIFCGDYRRTHLIARFHRYYLNLLSISQLVRRIHNIPEEAWMLTFAVLRLVLHNSSLKLFIVDSFPIKTYENHRSSKARIFAGKKYHGFNASKKQYFFGIKVHMIVDADGIPVEFMFTPGSTSDIAGLRGLSLVLPEGSTLLGDRAYTDYLFEERLLEIEKIDLLTKRRCNLKRQHSIDRELILSLKRNRIESTFSSIVSRMPRQIKARTEKGFFLKILLFILAHMVQRYFPMK